MNECPNPDCRERLDEVHETMFKDQEGGARFDIRKLQQAIVGKKMAWAFLIVFGLPAYITIVNVWAGMGSVTKDVQSAITKQQELTQTTKDHSEKLVRLEEKFITIKDDLKTMREQLRSDTREILDSIKDRKDKQK